MRPVGSRIRLIVAIGLVGLVLAAILVTQHFPLSPLFSVAISGIKGNCTAMIEDSSYSPVTAGSGTILFGCDGRAGWPPPWLGCPGACPSAFPVFNVSQTADYAALFKLPQYYTRLFIADTSGCASPGAFGSPQSELTSGSAPSQLTSGTKMHLSGYSSSPGFFYYCASYASVASTGATLSSFTISWGSGSTAFSQTFPSVTAAPGPQ